MDSKDFRIVHSYKHKKPFIVHQMNQYMFHETQDGLHVWKCFTSAQECPGKIITDGQKKEEDKRGIVEFVPCDTSASHNLDWDHPEYMEESRQIGENFKYIRMTDELRLNYLQAKARKVLQEESHKKPEIAQLLQEGTSMSVEEIAAKRALLFQQSQVVGKQIEMMEEFMPYFMANKENMDKYQ